jgi:hypothetical protein
VFVSVTCQLNRSKYIKIIRLPSVAAETVTVISWMGLHGSTVVWGTALQAERLRSLFPIGSLRFFFELFLPAAVWVDSASDTKECHGSSPGVKAAGCHFHVPTIWKSWELQPPGAVGAHLGMHRDSIRFLYHKCTSHNCDLYVGV